MDINKVTLIGRLTEKPDGWTTVSGQRCAEFTLATSYAWKDGTEKQETTEFHRVVVWGTLADIAATYLDKRSLVYVEGRLAYRTTPVEGSDRTAVEVIADEIIMLGSRSPERKSPASGGAASSRPIEPKR